MPVPKRKTSKSKRGMRRAGKGISHTSSSTCPTCQAFVMQHSACYSCGFYRGMKIMRTKEERSREREVAKKVKQDSIEKEQAKKKQHLEQQAKAEKTKAVLESSSKNNEKKNS